MSPLVWICLSLVGIASLVIGGYASRRSRNAWVRFKLSLKQEHLDAYQGWIFLTFLCASISVCFCTFLMVILLERTT